MPIKLVKRPKSPYWYLRGTIRRIRVEESTGTSDRRAAEEIRAIREAELLTQSIHGRIATATFAEAALSYLEQGGSRRFLAPIIQYLGTTPLAKIKQGAIERGARKLFPGRGPATLNRQFYTPTSAVLHHAAKKKWCLKPIIERPKQPTGRHRWLTLDEAEKLIEHSAPHLQPLVVFLLYVGARIGEALSLDWKQVDLSRAHVSFEKTKNSEARGVPLHPRVLAALANLKHREGAVFRRPDGEPYSLPKNITDTSAGTRVKSAFGGAARRAKLTQISPHVCRHTWATWHYQANRDLGSLQRLGGWKSVKMVMRYAHTNVAELGSTINRLPGRRQGECEPKQEIIS